MNKRILTGLIILMSFALIGIIAIQILWINNAIKLRKEQYSSAITHALGVVAKKLETKESVSYISKNKSISGDLNNLDTSLTKTIYDNISIESILNKELFNRFKDTELSFKKNQKKLFIKTKKNLALHSAKHQSKNSAIKEKPTEDSTSKFIDDYNHSFYNKLSQINETFNQLFFEFEHRNFPIQKRVDIFELYQHLRDELNNIGIKSDFSFALVDKSKKNRILYSSENFKSKNLDICQYTKLYPNDIINKDNYLYLNIDGLSNLIYSAIRYLLLGSMLFTLVILAVFVITIMIILRQKKISDIKTDFINNMTHEFKTPIATISLAADSIKNPKVMGNSESLLNFVKIIKDENSRMNSHVEKVLQMAMIDKGEYGAEIEDIDAMTIIEQAVGTIGIQVEKKGGELTFLPNADNHIIRVDELHFSNIIHNLLDNAIKYSPKNPYITIATKNENDKLIIEVKDNGIGISSNDLKFIFEKFYRVSTGNIHNVKGFGLGLSYVKKMTEIFGGKIEVKSVLNEGSTFILEFPIQK